MSYVLDALRRADAERQRGALPGLQSQPLAPADAAAARPTGRRMVLGAAALGLLVIGAGAAWWALLPQPPAPTVPVAAAPALVTPTPAPARPASVAPSPALPLPLPVAPPAAKAEPAYLPKSAASAAAPAPPATPAPPERLPTLAELPEAVRRTLPTLQAGGAMDSPQASARLLILNGQPFREGDQLAPGLTLQTIRLRSAVLDYRGTRFELKY
ncbi:general secretion pathway protein GspB [Aquincola sp. S2]|uniref:General secretion pathway protein GspB n=1 Tax=Pseudaquabacterium terrae TaxID=2732868 RepID=A0ABX2EU04_9BURK|nr:general secretion pathway protein GspB [Aquabacterium terrae]NRF72111.1 general secretion pathway protein GspB [Aquabacterium terrae]